MVPQKACTHADQLVCSGATELTGFSACGQQGFLCVCNLFAPKKPSGTLTQALACLQMMSQL